MEFFIQHGYNTQGPFRTEAVPARECWKPQPRRGNVVACRFMVKYAGRWRRLYSDHTPGIVMPHFINSGDSRLIVSGVSP